MHSWCQCTVVGFSMVFYYSFSSIHVLYTRKFSRYKSFAVHQANRIFAIIFLQITYYNFLRHSHELLHFSHFVAYMCFHMAAKDLSYYFQHQNDRLGLPNSMSQTCIDSVNQELSSIRQSDGSKSRGEYIKNNYTKDRAVISEYAAKNGIAAATRHFKLNEQFPSLKETIVRGSM